VTAISTSQVTNIQTGSEPNTFSMTVTSDHVAPFVWLEAKGIKGRFSDNGFLMYTSNVNLTFYAWETVDDVTLRKSITVKSLMDVYH